MTAAHILSQVHRDLKPENLLLKSLRDDHELKVYRDSNWQTIAAAGGTTETMLTMDGGSF